MLSLFDVTLSPKFKGNYSPPTVKKLQKYLTGFWAEKYTFLFSTYNRLLQSLTLRYLAHSGSAPHRMQKN